MKLNNKGMAISGILYSILILFLLLLFGILALLASSKYTFDKLKNDVVDKLSGNDSGDTTDAACFTFNYETGTITGYNFTFSQCGTNVVIPATINGVVVKAIANSAFYGGDQTAANKLKSVDFSNAIYLTEIGSDRASALSQGAFASNSITKIEFGNLYQLVKFGNFAFSSNAISGDLDMSGIPNITTIPNAMFYKNNLTSVTYANNGKITSIGQYAYYGNKINGELNLNLLPNLTTIGEYAFGSNSISSIAMDSLKKLQTIGRGAFSGNVITSLDINSLDELRTIGDYAFINNEISSLDLSKVKELTTIGSFAFQGNKIETLNFGSSSPITTLGEYVFDNNEIQGILDLTGLVKVSAAGDAIFASNHITGARFNGTYIPKLMFAYNEFEYIDFSTMPNVTTIDSFAFLKNTNLQTLKLENLPNLTAIGTGSFAFTKISSLKFPDTITLINDYAFYSSNISGTIDLSNTNNKVTIGLLAFMSNKIDNINFANQVTSLGGGAFNNNLLPDSQANVFARNEDGSINNTILASYGGENKTDVVVPSTVTRLDTNSYSGNNISKITFHSGITVIGDYALGGNKITSSLDFSIMPNLETIGEYAFAGYHAPSSEQTNYTATYWLSSLSVTSSYTKYTNSGKYTSSSGSNVVKLDMTGLSKLKSIGSNAFSTMGISNLVGTKDLVSLESIGEYAFAYNYLRTGIDFSNSVNLTFLGYRAFFHWGKNVYSGVIDLSNTKLTTIPSYTFYRNIVNTENLSVTVKLPDTLEKIENYAFFMLNVTGVEFPSSLRSIGEYAFSNNNIKAIILPEGFTTISKGAFEKSNIENVIIPSTLKSLPTYMFKNNSIKKLIIPEGVTAIGEQAFYNNEIEELTIPNTVTSLSISAFERNKLKKLDLSNLNSSIKTLSPLLFAYNEIEELILGSNITAIGTNAFLNNHMSKVVIPVNVLSISDNAFKQTDDYPWKSVTIEHNDSVAETRFYSNWEVIGWPLSIRPTQNLDIELVENVTDFLYVGDAYNVNISKSGYYKLEVWGAQGGTASGEGGRGGYSSGIVNLAEGTKLYVYVGGSGMTGTSATGGFNGGGRAYSSVSRIMASGGGATDIRIVEDSLYSRVIVAGGGGGGVEASTTGNGYTYSYGGGLLGGAGQGSKNSRKGQGGTQIAGGAGRTETEYDSKYIDTVLKGNFGIGGGSSTYETQYINGGGGGWYGGGAGGPSGGGGGGSGWVYTEASYNTWLNGNQSDATNWLLDNTYYLQDAKIFGGNTTFTSISGGTETGHIGDGYARITYIGESLTN